MNSILILISLIQLLLHISAHEIKFFSKCPQPDVVADFDYGKFLGKWYVIQKTKAASTCMTLDFKDDDNGKISVIESCKPMGINLPNIIEYFRQEGKLKVQNENYPAKMTVAYPFSLIPYTDVDLWVVDTDYTSYALTWSCRSIGIGNRQSVMILSRNMVLDQDIVNNLRNKLDSYEIDKHALSIVQQRDCTRNITLNPEDLDPEVNNPPHTTTETHTATVTVDPETETVTTTETQTTTDVITTSTIHTTTETLTVGTEVTPTATSTDGTDDTDDNENRIDPSTTSTPSVSRLPDDPVNTVGGGTFSA